MDKLNQIIKACIKQDRKYQFVLYKLYYGFMMKIALRYKTNKEDAQSIVNESFLKVFSNLENYKEQLPFELWLRKIAINTIIDDYRKNKKSRQHLDIQDTSEGYWNSKMTSTNIAEQEMNAESLRRLIACLPPISQEVFNLCVVDGYDYKEVSLMLEISEATCRWHVHFSRKKLQEMMGAALKKIETEAL